MDNVGASLVEVTTNPIIQIINFNNNPGVSLSQCPFLGGKANDKFFFIDVATTGTSAGVYVDTFDTTLNKWETNTSFTGKPYQFEKRPWTVDGSTGKAYSFQQISGPIDIFDTVNLAWSNSSLIPQTYQTFASSSFSALYGPSQVLLSNGQILYFPSEPPSTLYTTGDNTMTNILSYSISTDSWKLINTTGQIPSKRSDYSVVSTLDGRVIMYGGTSNNLSATPSIVVLNTSTYTWSTPSEINPVGPLSSHTASMVNNYMTVAFGINNNKNNKNVYKLDISDSLTYKWSLLSSYDDLTSNSGPNNNLIIAIAINVGIIVIGILSYGGYTMYKKKTRLSKNYIPT
ncbi:kelch repeat protein [Gigaspora margarita]|uniref:Kelch repeat protein n=1 Tax=Gigaspora margarita TaxID=4874 RepID=A0A8H4ARW2_GIGMA|nr:kelch repeat protein [Gigaspora margarita]